MKKNDLILNRLFYNNRFVLFFSIVLAVVIWLIVALFFSPEDKRIIKNVPVKIDLSNSVEAFDLQIFGTKDFFVDITVVGKRYVVAPNTLSSDDFSVVAKTNYVDSAGKQTLQLEVKPKAQSADFEISEVSNDFIEVYFDVYKEGEYSLVPEITYAEKAVPDGYFKDKEVLSAKTVTISGPAAEINKISKVVARTKIGKTLTTTKTFKTEILPLGEYGGTLRYLTINEGNDDFSVTIPVYKLVKLPASLSYKNIPPYYISKPLQYTCNPGQALFAVNETSLSNLKSFVIGSIDFSDLRSGVNRFNIDVKDISDALVMDNTKTFIIEVDTNEMTEKTLQIKQSNISLINPSSDFDVSLTGTGISTVTVIGPPEVLKTITSEDVYATVDIGETTISDDSVKIKAKLYVKNFDNCWVYGNYNAGIKVTPKQ